MRAGGRETSTSHEDMLLAGVYQQVTDQQGGRFAAGYDPGPGLDRYTTWLREHTEDHAPEGAAEASSAIMFPTSPGPAIVDSELEDEGARPTSVTETLVATGAIVPAACLAPAPAAAAPAVAVPAGWSADRAVTELYSVHYRALVRLAALLVRDVPTAEEVVQDAFVAMHGGWQRLRDAEKALAYLRQAVVNRSRSVLRHRTVVDKNLQKAPPDMPSAEHGALVLLERSAVVAALRGLPDRQREAIVLRYYADLSEAEIATTMGISRGAVKSHTARGMTALRAALEQE